MKIHKISGVSLLETLIGIAIIVTVLVGLVVSFQVFFRASLTNTEKIQASFLLEEGVEVVRYLRDDSWTSYIAPLTTNTNYYPTYINNTWTLSLTPTTTNSFTRTVKVHDVYRRDSNRRIVASTSLDANTLDLDIKFITVSVVAPNSKEMKVSTYIANIFPD